MLENGYTVEALLDEMAARVASKVRIELAASAAVAAVRPRLMTIDQAAIYLGRTKEAVQHLVNSGKIPTVRADRRVFLDVQDLDRWIEENKQAAI